MSSRLQKLRSADPEIMVAKVLTPYPPSNNFILGPHMPTKDFPAEMSKLFPKHHMEVYGYESPEFMNMSWDRQSVCFPSSSGDWIAWVDRVEKSKSDLWKNIGIYDAIQLSKHKMPFNKPLVSSALCFWSASTNTFHFRFGPMTVTLLDLAVLAGICPAGESVSARLEVTMPNYNIDLRQRATTYSTFIESNRRVNGEVDDREHVAFLLTWLCRSLLCVSSHRIVKAYYKLAVALSQGRKLALGPMLLGALYHGLRDSIHSNFKKNSGPIWILQLWLHAYFVELRPTSLTTHQLHCFGLNLVSFKENNTTWEECFSFFYSVCDRANHLFIPFSSFPFACPAWLRFTRPQSTEDAKAFDSIWASFLICRDLHYGLHPMTHCHKKGGVEVYNPQFAARQFGLVQGIPGPAVHSVDYGSLSRSTFKNVKQVESVEWIYTEQKKDFLFPGIVVRPFALVLFDMWWSNFITKYRNVPVELLLKQFKVRKSGVCEVLIDSMAMSSSQDFSIASIHSGGELDDQEPSTSRKRAASSSEVEVQSTNKDIMVISSDDEDYPCQIKKPTIVKSEVPESDLYPDVVMSHSQHTDDTTSTEKEAVDRKMNFCSYSPPLVSVNPLDDYDSYFSRIKSLGKKKSPADCEEFSSDEVKQAKAVLNNVRFASLHVVSVHGKAFELERALDILKSNASKIRGRPSADFSKALEEFNFLRTKFKNAQKNIETSEDKLKTKVALQSELDLSVDEYEVLQKVRADHIRQIEKIKVDIEAHQKLLAECEGLKNDVNMKIKELYDSTKLKEVKLMNMFADSFEIEKKKAEMEVHQLESRWEGLKKSVLM